MLIQTYYGGWGMPMINFDGTIAGTNEVTCFDTV